MRTSFAVAIAALTLAVAGPAAADTALDVAALQGLAVACTQESVGFSQRTLSLKVENGLLSVQQQYRVTGDNGYRAPTTHSVPLKAAVFKAGLGDLYGRAEIAVECRQRARCITVAEENGAAAPNDGVFFLTACDAASGREMLKILQRLR